MCMIAHARASHAQSNTLSVQRQEWRNADFVVVTMALVSDLNHSESIVLLKAFFDRLRAWQMAVG